MMIKYLNFPLDFRGSVVKTVEPDGEYFTIFINQNLTYEQQLETYNHEVNHILDDDFSCVCDVSFLENYCHK